jgi:Rap1a immunity proteins
MMSRSAREGNLMMRPLLLGVAVAALVAQPIDAQQPDTNSANYLLPACKNFLATGDSRPTTSAFYQGVCVGTVDTLHLLIRILPETPFRSCPPNQVTTGQELRVIIAYIEARPQRMHENFRILAIEAMREAWPCK